MDMVYLYLFISSSATFIIVLLLSALMSCTHFITFIFPWDFVRNNLHISYQITESKTAEGLVQANMLTWDRMITTIFLVKTDIYTMLRVFHFRLAMCQEYF